MADSGRYKKAADDVAQMVNPLDFDADEFANAMRREHPTLQQNFTRLCVAWIKRCAKDPETAFDDRNAGTKEFADRVVDLANDVCLPFI